MTWTLIALAVYVAVFLAYSWGCHVGYENAVSEYELDECDHLWPTDDIC